MGQIERIKLEHMTLKLWKLYGTDHLFLLKRIEKHHEKTFRHAIRVGYYSFLLGKELGLSEEEAITLLKSAYLHDVGMLSVPAEVLNKREELTEQDWEIIRSHCQSGVDIVGNCPDSDIDLDVILHHHENLDGTGYFGLTEQELSLPVRIVRVADSFDAMTNGRGNNPIKSFNEAFNELYRWSDMMFDANVVHTFHQLYKQRQQGQHNF